MLLGSGWIFVGWKRVTVKIVKWSPARASSYIPTPVKLRRKRCLLNIRNRDNNCFLYCIIAAHPELCPKDHRTRANAYKKHINRFNTEGNKS